MFVLLAGRERKVCRDFGTTMTARRRRITLPSAGRPHRLAVGWGLDYARGCSVRADRRHLRRLAFQPHNGQINEIADAKGYEKPSLL
jgi:hypothetical protein